MSSVCSSSESTLSCFLFFFFFNDTATTEIYTLSLHDALPISSGPGPKASRPPCGTRATVSRRNSCRGSSGSSGGRSRSEEHTSELQSQSNLVCRLLLEKKKKNYIQLAACIHNDLLMLVVHTAV